MQPLLRERMSRIHAGIAALYAAVPHMCGEGAHSTTKAKGAPPRRLDLAVHSKDLCRRVAVFFKAEGGKKFVRQTLCTVADMDKRFITRYIKSGMRRPGVATDTETLYGEVQIKWL